MGMVLANSLAIPYEVFLYIPGMFQYFKSYGVAREHASKYIISLGTQRIHMSLYFAVITIDHIVVFGANRMRNITLSVFRLL